MTKHAAPAAPRSRRARWLAAIVAALAVAAGTGAAAVATTTDEASWQQRLGTEGATIDAQIAGLQQQIDQLTADRDQLLLANDQLNGSNADLQSQVASLTAQRDQLQAQVDALTPTPSPSASASPSPSSSTTAPAPASILVGSSLYSGGAETPAQAFNRRCTDWGVCPEIVRYFYSGLPSGAWPDFGNAVEVVSFKVPNMAGFVAGNNDAEVKAWMDTVQADGTNHYVVLWHEPEDDIAAGTFTAAQYRAGLQHLQQLVAGYAGTGKRLKAGQVLMSWTLDPRSNRTVGNYLVPGLDFIGWDAYTGLSVAEIHREYDGAAAMCDSQGVAKCFLTETAPNSALNATQAQKAAFVTASVPIAQQVGFDGYMYFDSTVGGDFRLTTQQAFGAIAAEIRR